VRTRRLEKIAEATGKPLEFFVGEKPTSATAEDAWAEVLALLRTLQETEERNGGLLRELLLRLRGAGALDEGSAAD
jgi:hypothetical protein